MAPGLGDAADAEEGDGADAEGNAAEDKDAEASDDASDLEFICGYGRQGDGVWAVVISSSEGRTSVVALAAPAAHFDDVDLGPYDGGICDYVAYADLYVE